MTPTSQIPVETKAAVSCSEMDRMVGLSRQRFAQLQGATFPWPLYDVATRRTFLPRGLAKGVPPSPAAEHRNRRQAGAVLRTSTVHNRHTNRPQAEEGRHEEEQRHRRPARRAERPRLDDGDRCRGGERHRETVPAWDRRHRPGRGATGCLPALSEQELGGKGVG